MNNKKIIALILAFAMIFSTMTTAFADTTATIGADAEALKIMGVLQGDNSTGVTPEYLAKETTRMQAAIMNLRLLGLEDEAMAFTGTDNFADASTMTWGEGKAIMAYLKANPQLGWVGADFGKFEPFTTITAQQYYKVMLESLGYKQGTDFAWTEVMAFAASKGLTKTADVEKFTNNDVAIATVEALKTNVKDTTTTLVASMVEKGMISKEAAVAAGLIEDKAELTVAVDKAKALGTAVVEVEFEEDVDAAAAGNVENYAIEGVTINSVVVTGEDTVRLYTAAMTSGKVYKLTVGEKTVQFAGVAKVSGGPTIDGVVSEDIEEVVITFDKNVDYATATKVENYSIGNVEIVKAEVDGNKVTLTTEGLANKTKYTVKATDIKSIEGTSKRSNSDTFTSKFDTNAPKIDKVDAQTIERIEVTFNEKVTKESAENLDNYTIKVDDKDGADLDIVSIAWDKDDENKVEITTEPMEKREDYKLSVINVVDQRKAANTMTRPDTEEFKATTEDEDAPELTKVEVLSPTTILVEYTDDSKIDEASATDLNNYELEDLSIDSIMTIKNEWKTFRAILTVEEMETGKTYDLTVIEVADEFGNAIEEETKPAKAIAGNLASANLIGYVAKSENVVELKFDREVDETSAENIANYSIDEGVGAPTKATLEDDGVTVTLEVNDIINGYEEYDVIVDGVEDLAGNELYFKKSIDVTTNVWDKTAPELEDANIISSKVVSLSFDERVQFEDDAELVLAVGGVDSDDTNIKLTAADYSDDNTVVEFSTVTPLVDGTEYTVVGIVYNGTTDGGVKDMIGNRVLESTIDFGDFTFVGNDDEQEVAEVESYEQVNGTTFEVTMSRAVELRSGDASDKVTVGGVEFTVSVDADDNTIVKLVADEPIVEDKDYTFDFATLLADKHGIPVEDADDVNETILTGEYTDEDAPEIESVVAKDRYTIEITFSEDIKVMDDAAKTAFLNGLDLKNYDLDTNIDLSMDADNKKSDNDGDNVIKLTTSKPMEARYEYELTVGKGIFVDYVGLDNEDEETFYFDGTNLAK